MMDWISASLLPEATWPILPSVPHQDYAIDWSPPTSDFIEGLEYTTLQSNSFIAMDYPAFSPDMTNWQDIQSATMCNGTCDNTFGNPGFGSPARALSVGSRHLSIGSAGSSNHSWSSWRGRSRIKKVFSRSSSVAGRAKSAMKEGMSSWSLSGAKKHVSPSPRRTGKLTDVTRAGIRLLKDQGACWKCKILKKSVRNMALDVSLLG